MIHYLRSSLALAIVCGSIVATISSAQAIEPEQVGVATLPEPEPTWVISRDALGPRYIFDVANGQMVGMLSTSNYTPAVVSNPARKEIYAAESYYSRGTRGTRSDVLTIYDYENLAPVAEIEIPNKIAALAFSQYLALMSDKDHLAVFNLTPAQSVSIVNIASRKFVTEISTPGCSLIMPTDEGSFLQICADGRLQLIGLDANGEEIDRSRSEKIFDLEEDPLFDKPIATPNGWLLTSYGGKVFEATVKNNKISISKPWQLLSEDELAENWRPGGGQFIAYYAPLDLIFVLMNQHGEFSHDEPGSEVWMYSKSRKTKVAQLTLEQPGGNLHVSGGDNPLLTVSGIDGQLHVYDVTTTKHVRAIAEVGIAPGLLQGF